MEVWKWRCRPIHGGVQWWVFCWHSVVMTCYWSDLRELCALISVELTSDIVSDWSGYKCLHYSILCNADDKVKYFTFIHFSDCCLGKYCDEVPLIGWALMYSKWMSCCEGCHSLPTIWYILWELIRIHYWCLFCCLPGYSCWSLLLWWLMLIYYGIPAERCFCDDGLGMLNLGWSSVAEEIWNPLSVS